MINLLPHIAFAQNRLQDLCIIKGEAVSCADVAHAAEGLLGLSVIAIVAIIAVFVFLVVFWFAMLIHAIRKPIKHKFIWILVLLIFETPGALIYYFAVKRRFNKQQAEKTQ